jgi:hypothetical protein
MIYLAIGLIGLASICLLLAIFWTRVRIFLLVFSFLALANSYAAAPLNWISFVKGSGFWLTPILSHTPPLPLEKLALPTDSPKAIIQKMGCFVCHKIPGISQSRQSDYGPLLIPGTTAQQWVTSPDYQARVKAGKARATTPREYIIESILNPDAFIVPGYSDKSNPDQSLMYPHYAERFTRDGLERLADYLLTLDAQAALQDGLIFGHERPIPEWPNE